MSKSPVLVTGGAGFIGSALVHTLNKIGTPVIALDRSPVFPENQISSGALAHVKCISQDLLNTAALAEILRTEKIQAVVHLAAVIKVEESVANPELYMRINHHGTLSVLEAMQSAQVKNLVFASTAAVYGNVSVPKVAESHRAEPINPYGQSKLLAEKSIEKFAREHPDFSYFNFRFFNVAGSLPEFGLGPTDPKPTQLIRRACMALAGTGPELSVFGDDYDTADGSCIRDYIHVRDLIASIECALHMLTNAPPGSPLRETLNIGYGKGFSVLEIVRTLEQISGKPVPFKIQKRRPGDPAAVVADPEKALKILKVKWQSDSVRAICEDSLSWELRLAKSGRESIL